jgi:hypothetical protein
MNARILVNLLLAVASLLAAGYVLVHDPVYVPTRAGSGSGLLFAGPARLLLLAGLLGLAAFAGAVARAWMRGNIPLPPPGAIRPDAVYRGRIMARFWYLLLTAILCLASALLLARRAPDPANAGMRHADLPRPAVAERTRV